MFAEVARSRTWSSFVIAMAIGVDISVGVDVRFSVSLVAIIDTSLDISDHVIFRVSIVVQS